MNLKAIKEDRPIVESQIPQAVPTDLATELTELNVAGDGLSVAYRKLLKKYLKQD